MYKYEFKYRTFHTVSSIGRGVGSILTKRLKYSDGAFEVSWRQITSRGNHWKRLIRIYKTDKPSVTLTCPHIDN